MGELRQADSRDTTMHIASDRDSRVLCGKAKASDLPTGHIWIKMEYKGAEHVSNCPECLHRFNKLMTAQA